MNTNKKLHHEFELEPIDYARREFKGWIRVTDCENSEDDTFIIVNSEQGVAYASDFDGNRIAPRLSKHQQKYWLEYATELFENRFEQEIEQAEQERKAERREWLKMARTCTTRELETI